jgi:hypothetical protein
MQLEELKKALDDIVKGKEFEKYMWKYLQSELTGTIMYWQRDQLFNKSIGADGVKFGKYSNESRDKGRYRTRADRSQATKKKANLEYTLIDTGDFYDKMYVKVDRRSKTIDIGSTTEHMDEMYDNPAFNTHEFFGLTPHSLRQIMKPLKIEMARWVRLRILYNRRL